MLPARAGNLFFDRGGRVDEASWYSTTPSRHGRSDRYVRPSEELRTKSETSGYEIIAAQAARFFPFFLGDQYFQP